MITLRVNMNITKEQIREWLLKLSDVTEEGDFEWLCSLIHDCIQDIGYKWVSAEDELPESWVCVLAFTKHSEYQLAQYEENYWDCLSDVHTVSADITHWMSLPEPPERGN